MRPYFVCAMLLLLASFVLAADSGTSKPAVPSGRVLFAEHCASCHGVDAKGAGPAALTLKIQPPDLTSLAKRDGKFPYDQVYKTIDGDFPVTAHGTREMPTWGALFLALTDLNQQTAEQYVRNLTNYIKSIQGK